MPCLFLATTTPFYYILEMDRKLQSRCEWPITGEEIIVFKLKAFKEERMKRKRVSTSRKCGS